MSTRTTTAAAATSHNNVKETKCWLEATTFMQHFTKWNPKMASMLVAVHTQKARNCNFSFIQLQLDNPIHWETNQAPDDAWCDANRIALQCNLKTLKLLMLTMTWQFWVCNNREVDLVAATNITKAIGNNSVLITTHDVMWWSNELRVSDCEVPGGCLFDAMQKTLTLPQRRMQCEKCCNKQYLKNGKDGK